MSESVQRLRVLYLMKIFQENTDEQHPMKVAEIIRRLRKSGIEAERKTIYADIENLRTFGMDIINRRSRPSGFYLGSREFELPELKLLVDAVQSSRFISPKKTQVLIKKLESLTSTFEAGELQQQVFPDGGIKTSNENVFLNIDQIHQAIMTNSKLSFQYFEWTFPKQKTLKKNGDRYLVSPWQLVWQDENYYLIALDDQSQIVKHYRVDKMINLESEPSPRSGHEIFTGMDAARYVNGTFSMFGGKEEQITLAFSNSLIGVVLDRFGQNIFPMRLDDDHFSVIVKLRISDQFYGWLSGLGSDAWIMSPESLRKDYKKYLHKILKNYRSSNTHSKTCENSDASHEESPSSETEN